MKLQIAIDSAKFEILGFIIDKYHKAMEQKKIQEKVNDIVAEVLGMMTDEQRDRLKPEAKLADDLGCDSLDGVDITIAIEGEFDIKVPDEIFYNVAGFTLAEVYEITEKLIKGKNV